MHISFENISIIKSKTVGFVMNKDNKSTEKLDSPMLSKIFLKLFAIEWDLVTNGKKNVKKPLNSTIDVVSFYFLKKKIHNWIH